ncbi:hypothetical protein [Flavihumibacter sp. UBA7668]|uniref:hypothetical protein n=1 Tax=Flavihumibacter sp. UBA7668 TaxID=1946542 RepID=UPI0025C2C576|nr:hypothetical protein [Flavihumibacter sp. UBA7668]
MEKTILLVVFLCGFYDISFSQSFQHGAGTGYAHQSGNGSDGTEYVTLLYSPRIRFAETDNSSFTIGIPVSLGLAGGFSYSSSLGNTSTFQYLIHAPLMINYNSVAGSSKNTSKRFGYFGGAGFGLNYGNFRVVELIDDQTGFPYYDYRSKTRTSFGPSANAGLRFGVGRQTRSIEVLISYMKGLSGDNPHYLGLGALFNFN